MTSCREKFQELLRELFQFDCADLDFGIYRIMNYKRDVIENFIARDLPKVVADELDRDALADQSQAAKELKEVADQITQTLGKDALDADGKLADAYHGIPLGKKYLDLKAKAAGSLGREALEASIFNHLYTFFSRYYQDGDFISKRRYSKRQRYAIPYNGEEVYLHWANNDQYYVKTAEHFHDYTFTSRGVTVHFKLQAATVEQNNVKGDKRFFLPRAKETEWKQDAGELIIPFEYRPLTDQEEITYGKKNQQDAIIAQSIEEIAKRLKQADKALVALTAERHKNSDGQPVTFLEHHLRQYTRRNTSDFFIHKDLRGFLSRELDFYLKNEVLNLDEMETAGEDRADGWFQIMRVIKAVGGRIIEFLDQIECFQKMLWEKRKFITETQYCITMGNIDEGFYPDIAVCDPQWVEWKELFHIDEEQTDLFNTGKGKKDKRIAFLKAYPTLVLDTKHFAQDFVDRLLASFDHLDEMTDGLLVHSENYQALNLLTEKYREKIKAIYIDPPYNAEATKILYKNDYEHSSWLTLLQNGFVPSRFLLGADAIACVTIDDYEVNRIILLLDRVFLPENRLATVVIRNNPSGRSTVRGFSINHEYGLFYSRSDVSVLGRLPHSEDQKKRYDEISEEGRKFEWENFRKSSAGSRRSDRPKQFFPLYFDDHSGSFRIPTMKWQEAGRAWEIREDPRQGEVVIWPKDEFGSERVWRYGVERTKLNLRNLSAKQLRGKLEVYAPKYFQEKGVLPRTWWDKPEYSARDNGTRALANLFGSEKLFEFPKAPAAVKDCLTICSLGSGEIALDYFAGSGTTAQAVIELNRDDDGSRGFILVEVEYYFNTVLLPRIKKVTFTPEWKDGKPGRMATDEEFDRGPRIVKYMRIESYEDVLNNIEFDDASGQQALKFDDYLIKYMLKWETRKSETLLNVEKLARPFSYKLHIRADGQTREKVADIPETFNYLLGLHVQTRRVYDDSGRRYLVYRGKTDNRQIVVIWRETEGWQKADMERDKKFVAEKKLTEGADEVFVNGDSFIPNAKALEPLFKARMFAEVQA